MSQSVQRVARGGVSKMGKKVLVTGASTGIGRSAVELLAARGDTVFAGARKDADLDALGAISGVVPVKIDVTDAEHIAQTRATLEREAGHLDAVVNNAGITVEGPLMELDTDALRHQFEVNVFGLHEVTRTVFPLLQPVQGRIVNISSIAALVVTPFLGPYCMSKFSVEAYSDALRRELAPLGMRVVVVQPGPTKTEIWNKTSVGSGEFDHSIFGERAESIGRQMVDRAAGNGFAPERVAKFIVKAVHAPSPRPRYLVTPEKLPQWILSKMPDRVIDFALKQVFG